MNFSMNQIALKILNSGIFENNDFILLQLEIYNLIYFSC